MSYLSEGWAGNLNLGMVPGENGKTWVVGSSFSYRHYTVPPGTTTDGASIPRFFWRVIGCPIRAWYAPAAVLHDYFYRTQTLSRAEADLILLEAMLSLAKDSKLYRAQAFTIYYAVHSFGQYSWKKNKKQLQKI